MDLATAKIEQSGISDYIAYHGDDRNLFVQFEMVAEKQGFESEAQGRPVFKDQAYITIMFPGDKTRKISRRVQMNPMESAPFPPDPERFPKQWAAFQSQQEQPVTGMPIDQWAPLTKSMAAELKANRVFTVEQLSAVPDSALHTLGMGGRELREKAQVWLKQAESGAETLRLTAENAQLRSDLELLKAQVAEIAALKKASK